MLVKLGANRKAQSEGGRKEHGAKGDSSEVGRPAAAVPLEIRFHNGGERRKSGFYIHSPLHQLHGHNNTRTHPSH